MHTIINIIYPMFSILCIFISIYHINFIKLNPKSIIAYTILNYITLYLIRCYNLNKEYTALTLIFTIIFLFYNSKKIIYAFIISFISVIVIVVSDSIITIIAVEIFNINYETLICDEKLYIFTQFILVILVNVISKLTGKFTYKFNNKPLFLDKFPKDIFNKIKKDFYIECSLIIISIFIFLLAFSNQLNNKTLSPTLFISISLILLCFISFSFLMIAIREYKSQIKKEYESKEFKELYEYTKSLEDMSLYLKKYEDNFLEILSSIRKYIDENDMVNLKEFYYNTLLTKQNEIISRDHSLDPLNHLNESTLKSIILSKFITAKANGLKVKITITENIPSIPIKINDICKIISTLLDIAINDAKITPEKFIHFSVINTDTTIVFIIQNSYSDSVFFSKTNKENVINKNKKISTVLEIISQAKEKVNLNSTYFNGTLAQELTIQK